MRFFCAPRQSKYGAYSLSETGTRLLPPLPPALALMLLRRHDRAIGNARMVPLLAEPADKRTNLRNGPRGQTFHGYARLKGYGTFRSVGAYLG